MSKTKTRPGTKREPGTVTKPRLPEPPPPPPERGVCHLFWSLAAQVSLCGARVTTDNAVQVASAMTDPCSCGRRRCPKCRELAG